MPTPTYTALATTTLGATAGSVTFSSIPATYRDLVIVANWPDSSSAPFVLLRLNGDSGTNYSWVQGYADTGGPNSDSASSVNGIRVGYSQIDPSMIRVQVMDYSATDKHTTVLARSDQMDSNTRVSMFAGRWANTAAVTSAALVMSSGSFAIGSTFSLYGIEA
jgi:hypothetical protein